MALFLLNPKIYGRAVMLNNLVIDKMRQGEEKQISELIKNIFNEFIAPEYSEEGINNFLDYIEQINIKKRSLNSNHFVLTAKINDRIIGIIEIRKYNHICLLFVDKNYHKNGIRFVPMKSIL